MGAHAKFSSFICLLLVAFAAGVGAVGRVSADPESASRAGAPPTIYQEILRRGEPSDWKPANQNPPTFRWPIAGPLSTSGSVPYDSVTYELQYAADPDFTDPVHIRDLDRTFFRPPAPLPPGEYYWRYRVSGGEWSAPLPVSIGDDLPQGFSVDWEPALAKVPAGHPRIWVWPETAAQLATQARLGLRRTVLAQWRARAMSYVGAQLALSVDKERVRSTDYNVRVGQTQSALGDAEQTMGPAAELAFLYLLTGDQTLGDEAIRRAMAATQLDPDGYTSLNVTDLGNAEIVRGAALVYDYLYDRLTAEQRSAIRRMLEERLSRIYAAYRPSLEQRVYISHAWQHIMTDFLTGALALYGETPEARAWFEWGLQMFIAFYPWWGSVDGSSGGSPAYAMGTGLLHYSHLTAELIRTATGIDFMAHPWFAANPMYIIYAHPPGSLRSQFGDFRAQFRPSTQLHLPMLRYAQRFQNPYAQSYADAVAGLPNVFETYVLYFLTPLGNNPARRPLSELPKARAFPDVGVVYMHSDIADPKNNIMFEFKSGPLGSFGHSHADQNSFNIVAFGEVLALDSGYYIGYGDTHHYGWTVTTQAHNAILIDGQGQPSRNMDAYGRLVGFFTGGTFHYTVGSAATAYRQLPVDRFLRHVLWIEPNAYIVYDQIDLGLPGDTQWLLHALQAMEINEERRWVYVRQGKARLSAFLAYPESGDIAQTDQFAVPVPARPLRGAGADYPNQWHLTAHSPGKREAHRWLTVLFVHQEEAAAPPVQRVAGEGWLGLHWDSEAGAVRAGFSESGSPVAIALGEFEATAASLAVSQAGDAGWSLFATRASELRSQGTRLLTSDAPLNLEVTQAPERTVVRLQADAAVNVRIARPSRPEEVQLDGREAAYGWDEDAGELILALPPGEHVLEI